MKPPSLLLLAPLLLALPSHGADQREQLACGPSESLLAVRFSMSEEQYLVIPNKQKQGDGTYAGFPTITVSTPPGPEGSMNETQYTSEFADLVDYEQCVPREGPCLNVVLDGFPKGTYEISRDGEAVVPDLEFVKRDDDYNKTTVSAEVGENCAPQCHDGEGLFELNVWSPEGRTVDFRVDDGGSDTVLGCRENDCQPYWRSLYKRRACLPKDVCHTLLLGKSLRYDPDADDPLRVVGSYAAIFDGETLDESRYWMDTSLRFGGNCEPLCHPETQSLVKLFSVLTEPRTPGEISWELGPVTVSSPPPYKGDLSSESPNSNVIYYQTMCLPKVECSTFRITTNNPESPNIEYSLTVDGTVLRDTTWFPGNGTFSWETMNQTTFIGNCSIEDCGDSESLLSVDFAVVSDDTAPGADIWWRLQSGASDYDSSLPMSSSFFPSTLPLGTRYRAQQCVPVIVDASTGEASCQYELIMRAQMQEPVGTFPLEDIRVTRDGAEQPVSESLDRMWANQIGRRAGFGAACYATSAHSGGEGGATGKSAGTIMSIVVGSLVCVAFGVV